MSSSGDSVLGGGLLNETDRFEVSWEQRDRDQYRDSSQRVRRTAPRVVHQTTQPRHKLRAAAMLLCLQTRWVSTKQLAAGPQTRVHSREDSKPADKFSSCA
eukprot:2592192-Rhodomonas_salina.2